MSVDTDVLKRSVTKDDEGPSVFQFIVAPEIVDGVCVLPDLKPFWTPDKDVYLRSTMHVEGFWASAVRRGIALAAARAWEVKGDVDLRVRRAQELFLAANTIGYSREGVAWGQGWEHYLDQHLRAYTLTNNGAFTEVVYNKSKVIGFIHLDPFRCRRTGDPMIPVVYTDAQGAEHELKAHEVFYFSDLSSESMMENSVGHCAAQRAYDEIRVYASEQLKYFEKVTGRRADEMHWIGGITDRQLKSSQDSAEREANKQGLMYHMGAIVSAVPGDVPLSKVSIRFAGLAEDHDRLKSFRIATYRYALALDLDPQDLAPQENMGPGAAAQSRTLDEKSQRSVMFGWDRRFVHAVNRFLLDDRTRFFFSDSDNVGRRRDEAEVFNRFAHGVGELVDKMVLTPPQAVQIGVDRTHFPPEFLESDETAVSRLGDDERPTALEHPQDVAQPTAVEFQDDAIGLDTNKEWATVDLSQVPKPRQPGRFGVLRRALSALGGEK